MTATLPSLTSQSTLPSLASQSRLPSLTSPSNMVTALGFGLATAVLLSGTAVPAVREPYPAPQGFFSTAPRTSAFADPLPGLKSPAPLSVNEMRAGEGVVRPAALSNSEMLADIRRTSGFTWEQVAKIFGVSRRTVHLWVSGSNMSSRHEERLAELAREVEGVTRSGVANPKMAYLALLDDYRKLSASVDSDISRPAPLY